MAEMMKALRTFEGNEGYIRRGDTFEVETAERADQLEKLKLAERTEAGEVTNLQQKNAELNDMTKAELEKVAEEEGAEYRDGATKDEIKTAIIYNREREYYKQEQENTAGTENTAGNE